MTTTVFSSDVASNGLGPVFIYKASGDGLIVNPGVTLSSDWMTVAAPEGLADLHATINGTLAATIGIAAYGSSMHLTVGSAGRMGSFTASYDSTVENHGNIRTLSIGSPTDAVVENWGTVSGAGAGFFTAYDDDTVGNATFINHGTVDLWRNGVSSRGTDMHIVNDGSIVAEWTAVGVYRAVAESDVSGTIHNDGTIELQYGRAIRAGAPIELTNNGTISGPMASLYFFATDADTVTNNGHLDGQAQLGGGDDVYHGENGRVTGAVWGQAGDDLLVGGAFAEFLGGGSGDDTLTGGAGMDRLTGAAGADLLSGGRGEDAFRFVAAGDSLGDGIVASGGVAAFQGVGTAGGDRIDVSAIDANAGLADFQHFVFGTSHDVGHLWAEDVGDVTHIRGNVSGNATPEFDLAIHDGAGITAADYAGVDFIL